MEDNIVIEKINKCPNCGSEEKKIIYENQSDKTYYSTIHKWNIFTCLGCEVVYLNERPTPETIKYTYLNYSTHSRTERLSAEKLKGIRWLQRILANGYKNWRFGTHYEPSTKLGIIAAYLMPSKKAIMDREFRKVHHRQEEAEY